MKMPGSKAGHCGSLDEGTDRVTYILRWLINVKDTSHKSLHITTIKLKINRYKP